MAASVTSPCAAPKKTKAVIDACSSTDRIMMSPFTRNSRSIRSRAHNPPRRSPAAIAARANHSPSANALHSAISVAVATPATPQPSPSTNHRSNTTLMPVISTCTARIARVRSTAISQPVSAYSAIGAGAPQMRTARYCRASASTSAEAGASRNAAAKIGRCRITSASPTPSATVSARSRCAPDPVVSPAPWACATSPDVPIRRNPNTQ